MAVSQHMEHNPARWKADYERDGYLVVENVLDTQTLSTLRAGIERITADPDTLPDHLRRHIQFERDYVKKRPDQNDHDAAQVGDAVRNIMELPLFDPVFGELIAYEPLLEFWKRCSRAASSISTITSASSRRRGSAESSSGTATCPT